MSDRSAQVLSLRELSTGPIERLEEGENTVRYSSIKLLSPGIWTDSGSRQTIWYSPEGVKNLEVAEDNVVNIMHDVDNEVSAAGRIDPESVEATDDGLFADVVLDTSNAAGQYADENMQKTLETQGAKGFGGPSVEIAKEGQKVEYNPEKGMQELKAGIVDGTGFVANPASKPVSFARQTAERGVALSDGQDTMILQAERDAMNLDPEQVRSKLEGLGVELGDDVSDKELEEFAANLLEDDPDEEEDDEEEEEKEQADDEEEPEEEEGEDDEEEEEPELSNEELVQTVQALQERVQNLEDMAESMMAAEDVKEELEEFEQDLADAETVSELSEAKEDLEKRLSELEDEPTTPKSLADAEGESEGLEGSPQYVGEFDSRRRTYSR